jgi:glycosyltransferase involved in cell wall biosynthesis
VRAAYVTTYDAREVGNWSGLGYFIGWCLESASVSVDYVGPFELERPLYRKAKRALHRALGGRSYLAERDPRIARRLAERVDRRLRSLECDVIVSPGTIPVAWSRDERPVAFWTDATFGAMVDYYPNFRRLSKESLRAGFELDARALEHASLAIYASDWAARSAIADHGADPAKVHVVPFGANLEQAPARSDVEEALAARADDVCRLLLLGVDWQRKGGDVAVAVTRLLNERGVPTELHVAGCEPPEAVPAFVHRHGFISKGTPEGRNVLTRLLSRATFLILPSRCEAYGLVLCEANAYGVPCVASRTGGITTIVRDGINGMTFELDDVEGYADYIERLFADRGAYLELAGTALGEFETRLNWAASGRIVKTLLSSSCIGGNSG